MTYSDVPSGIVVHAGETVSVLTSLEDTVRVWPAPVPAVIVTTNPAHWLTVHALIPALVVSWSVVLVCPMTYWDVPSGIVVQTAETVSLVEALEVTVRDWPTPVPGAMERRRPDDRRAR